MKWNQFKSIATLKIFIPGNPFTLKTPGYIGEKEFKVHASTHPISISTFLQTVSDENICVSKGSDGGLRIGCGGAVIDKLFIYLDTKKK